MFPPLLIVLLSAIPIVVAISTPEWFDHDAELPPRHTPLPPLGFAITARGDQYFAAAMQAGSPASHTGIADGDRILAIDGVDIRTALTRSSREFGCPTRIEYLSHGQEQSATFDRCGVSGNVEQ